MGKGSKRKLYKTIRHGENSLQYTILPQSDDFRLEGRIHSVTAKVPGKDSSKTKQTRSRQRRIFFAYLGVIFICTILVGAILIPFLVSAECLPNPTDWFLKAKNKLMNINLITGSEHNLSETVININNDNLTNNNNNNSSNNYLNTNNGEVEMNVLQSNNMDFNISSTPSFSSVLKKQFTIQSSANFLSNLILTSTEKENFEKINDIRTSWPMKNITNLNKPIIMGTSTKQMINQRKVAAKSDYRINDLNKDNINELEIFEDSTTFQDLSINNNNNNNKDNNKELQKLAWIHNHWPYIDPSTYFQWNGYKIEDSILLPALLGVSLVSLIFIVTICLIARNKRSILSNVRRRKNDDIEGIVSGDNANLLTNNLSDED